MMLPVQPSTVARSESSAQSRDISQILPSNAEQSARVVNVRQDPVSPTLFRVALDVGNNRLEVMTNRPLAQGLSVVLSRDGNGEVVLRIPVPTANPTQTSQAQAQALSQINSSSNQFIAMIAPESRAQAQQLLNQAQMTALVQPQAGNPSQQLAQQGAVQSSLTSALTNPQLQTNNPSGQTNSRTTQSGAVPSNSSSSSATSSSNSRSAPSAATSSQIAGNINTGGAPVSTNNGSSQNLLAAQGAAQNNAQTLSTIQTAPSATLTPASATQTPLNTGNALASSNNPTATGSTGNSVNTNSASGSNTTPPIQTSLQSTTQAAASIGNPTQTSMNAPNSAQLTGASLNSAMQNQTSNSLGSQALVQTANITTAPSSQTPQANPLTSPASTGSAAGVSPAQPTAQSTTQSTTQSGIALAHVVQSIQGAPSLPAFARATLNFGGETLNIVTPRPLLAGQQIEVTRLNDMAIQVRILPQQAVKSMPPEVVEEMQALLRQVMPTQAPLADSLNQLRSLNRGQSQDAVGQIVRSLMSLFSLTPQTQPKAQAQQVQQMMQQSGLFTENRMAQQAKGHALNVEDLRTRLGQLRRASQELPSQIREQMLSLIDRAEARSTHQQIHSARQWRDYPDGSAERYFRMDLPLQTPEGFKQVELELKEQRRPRSPTEMQTNWTLNLHFDLEPLGSIDARVHLEDEWDMSIAFWAESLGTTDIIRDRIEGFSKHLTEQGFNIDTINVRKGRAPNNLSPTVSKHLVDVHT